MLLKIRFLLSLNFAYKFDTMKEWILDKKRRIAFSTSTLMVITIFIMLENTAKAQLPLTDIYAFSIVIDDDYNLLLSAPALVNSFNINGYNNQPNYGGADIWYITYAEEGSNFTDIISLDFSKMNYSRITKTEGISEFSPTPGISGQSLYTVRIESDLKTQTLWQYPKDKSAYGSNLLPQLKNVGYFTQLDKSVFAIFEVGEPHLLNIHNITTRSKNSLIQNPGRCLRTNSTGQLVFVHKLLPELFYLKSYDIKSDRSSILTQIKTEDFEMIDDKLILSFDGANLMSLHLEKDREWKLVADLSVYGILKPNRLAYGNGRLLIVNNKN